MRMQRVMFQIPKSLKSRLDAERKRGTSASGLIRYLLHQYFKGEFPVSSLTPTLRHSRGYWDKTL